MSSIFPPLPGRVVRVFSADMDGSGVRPVELWETDEPFIGRVVRWQVQDAPALFSEALADQLIVLPQDAAAKREIIGSFAKNGHSVFLEDEHRDFLVLKLGDPVLFWSQAHSLRRSLAPIGSFEAEFILRLNPPAPSSNKRASSDLRLIGVPKVWSKRVENDRVRIALIDTGVDLDHPCLKKRLVYDAQGMLVGFNVFSRDSPPVDDHIVGHGTFCAGLIAGSPMNVFEGGVLREEGIIPIKAFDRSGMGTSRLAFLGLEYAMKAGARVVSASWSNLSYSKLLRLAIERAGAHGCLFVTAAGNYGIDLDINHIYPACYELSNIMTVGGLSEALEPVVDWGIGKHFVHLSAPGESVLSTQPRYLSEYDLFEELSGTSAATAFVAGAAALVQGTAMNYSKRRLSPEELKKRIVDATKPLNPRLSQASCSRGCLNVENAVGIVAGTYVSSRKLSCP